MRARGVYAMFRRACMRLTAVAIHAYSPVLTLALASFTHAHNMRERSRTRTCTLTSTQVRGCVRARTLIRLRSPTYAHRGEHARTHSSLRRTKRMAADMHARRQLSKHMRPFITIQGHRYAIADRPSHVMRSLCVSSASADFSLACYTCSQILKARTPIASFVCVCSHGSTRLSPFNSLRCRIQLTRQPATDIQSALHEAYNYLAPRDASLYSGLTVVLPLVDAKSEERHDIKWNVLRLSQGRSKNRTWPWRNGEFSYSWSELGF
eukprot:6207105-Pleurochrysis_carterae.AAC.1